MVNRQYHRYGTAPSVIRELYAYGLKKAAETGADSVFDFTLGNPSIPAPEAVNAAVHELTNQTDSLLLHGYSMGAGFQNVRERVAESLSERFHASVRPDNLFFTCGAAPAVLSALKALVQPGESEVLLIAPYFPEYTVFAEEAGAKVRVAMADPVTFQIDCEAVREAVSEKTQVVLVNSPNNPSGAVYGEETLRKLASVLSEKSEEYGHPVYLVADEPYRELAYDGILVPWIPDFYDNTIVCYSYSKSLSLPGERIGYVLVGDRVTDARDVFAAVSGAARATGHVCAPTLFQRVIAQCVSCRPDLKAYDQNRRFLHDALRDIGYEVVRPDGAFYLFVKAPSGDANAFMQKAKEEHTLLVVPGDSFGCPGYFRLAYCVSHDMIRRSVPAFRAMFESFQ